MRKILALFVILSVVSLKITAQTLNNWIDYSKTYYKFKVGPFYYYGAGAIVKDGPVRITQPALSAAGLGSTPAEQLQLWHNGQQIPIYITKDSGVLGSSDYIEFWGEIPDGKVDSALYASPAYQISQHWSLESDSSAYFFTVNPAGANKRFVTAGNNPASATIQPDQNFIYTAGQYYRSIINQGRGAGVTQGSNSFILYSSSYGAGEGLTSRYFGPYNADSLPWGFSQLHSDTSSGGLMTATFSLAGAALNARNIEVDINNGAIANFPLNYYNAQQLSVNNLPVNLLQNDAFTMVFKNLSGVPGDMACVSQAEVDYPRLFDFSGVGVFEFYLAASDTGRLIKIGDFSTNGAAPVLYDITNGVRYVGDVQGDSILFLLQPSAQQYRLALVRGDGSLSTQITSFTTRNFTNFSAAANQGNYLIISNQLLYGNGSNNYVQQYATYRSSAAGGGYNVKVIDIQDLEDQFAWGVKRHPLAVKSFLQYANSTFSTAPAYVFLIGKGMDYSQYRLVETDPLVYQTALVPTYGAPGSDNLLTSPAYDPVPATPTGRLSAVSPAEVGIYLAKVQQFEAAQQDTAQTLATKSWMKNVLHVTGGSDAVDGAVWDGYMQAYKNIIIDTLFGANVTSFSKSASPSTYPEQLTSFDSIFNLGSSILNYFGHSSAVNLDFSLSNPQTFTNTGKYPLFIVNGCLAGNIFDYDAGRLSTLSTLSEKFVLAPQTGAIGFEATSSNGADNYLNIYTTQIYQAAGVSDYGKGLGKIMQDAVAAGFNITGPSDFYGRIHAEQYAYQGDPAINLNAFSKPDYAIFSSDVTINPSFVSVADDSFSVKILVHNLGKATNDSVHFTLFRKQANGDSAAVFTKEFATLKTEDSVMVTLPLVPNRDSVLVNLTASIDDNRSVNEITYSNNVVQIPVTVSSAEIRPIFPYNYAVVPTDIVTLSASTANPLDTAKQYIMEMDTTALFNSPVKSAFTITSSGGVVQFKNLPLPLNNTVYYWHIAPVGINQHWNMFSFVHRTGATPGFEQAHYYQQTQSSFNNLILDSSRNYDFGTSLSNLFVKQAIYPYSGTEDNDFSVSVNGTFVAESACVGTSILFNVFNPTTLAAIPNPGSLDGSGASCKGAETINDFEFDVTSPATRNNAYTFLTSFVNNGWYVVARSIDIGDFAPVWAADSTYFGANNTLYSFLKTQGILIDQYTYPRCYIFMFKKNDSTSFSPVSIFSQGLYDAISLSENLPVADTLGYVTSPKFGPAKQWDTVFWQGTDINPNNFASLNIIGIDKNNNDTVLYTIDKSQAFQDISAVNAATYPYIQLQMRTQDSITSIPHQLTDWSVKYLPVPEGAVAPNLGFSMPDTVVALHPANTQFDTLQGYVAFKNVSVSNFDSLRIALVLYDTAGNVVDTFPVARTKALVAGDTINVSFIANVTSVPQGKYDLFLMVNADNDQPEQYLFNNSVYKYVYIKRTSSTLPVTLLNFTGAPDGKGVMLNWKVTNQINFSYYGVERSVDGINFTQIGSVAAVNGNPAETMAYNFFDNNPAVGKNYYRLKLVNKDGLFNYSGVVVVQFGGGFAINVFPNPFGNQLNIAVTGGADGTNFVRVLDLTGRSLVQQSFSGGSATIDVSGLAAGTYIVQVNNGGTVQTFKLQKHAE